MKSGTCYEREHELIWRQLGKTLVSRTIESLPHFLIAPPQEGKVIITVGHLTLLPDLKITKFYLSKMKFIYYFFRQLSHSESMYFGIVLSKRPSYIT